MERKPSFAMYVVHHAVDLSLAHSTRRDPIIIGLILPPASTLESHVTWLIFLQTAEVGDHELQPKEGTLNMGLNRAYK